MARATILNKHELSAVKSFRFALDPKRPGSDVLKDVGSAVRSLIFGLYLRRKKQEPHRNSTFQSLTGQLVALGIIKDPFLKSTIDFIRINRNIAEHGTDPAKGYMLKEMKRLMVIVFTDFQKIGNVDYGLDLENRRVYKGVKNTPGAAIDELVEKGIVSLDDRGKNLEDPRFGGMRIEDKPKGRGGLCSFSYCLIDKSGSMGSLTEEVINGQHLMIEAFRKSEKCQRNLLYFGQALFNEELEYLNAVLSPLKPDGKDKIVALSKDNYKPSGCTALHDAIFNTLKSLHIESVSYKSEHSSKPKIHIGVITDGFDYGPRGYNTGSKEATAEDVRKLVIELKKDKLLLSSNLVGFTSNGFNEEHLKKMAEEYAFDDYIAVDASNPKEIRRAFELVSKHAISM